MMLDLVSRVYKRHRDGEGRDWTCGIPDTGGWGGLRWKVTKSQQTWQART